jgi:hypothetical protein
MPKTSKKVLEALAALFLTLLAQAVTSKPECYKVSNEKEKIDLKRWTQRGLSDLWRTKLS